ncbi:hypothetical protein L7F22_066510 [Adiantum nelumboides]|nr:hypothetical protein [Adiantum nelumboides]
MLAQIAQRTLRPLARSIATHQGPPVRVAFTPDAGRGVFATRNIRHGGLIHTAEPLLAHPSLQNVSKVCYFCLKRLEIVAATSTEVASPEDYIQKSSFDGLQQKFCSKKCFISAEAFFTVEKQAMWKTFHQFCNDESLRLPLLAKRLVCMVLAGVASKDAVDILSFVKPPQDITLCWMHTRAMLLDAFKGSGVPEEQLAFISGEWYCGVLARLSLNSFRIELLAEDTRSLLMAAVASVSGDAISGSAVYILPSMYNHDCDPNVDITWPTNSTAHLTARRDIKEGEELRITYIDASMVHRARQQLLRQAYHFVCNCGRCKDEEEQ